MAIKRGSKLKKKYIFIIFIMIGGLLIMSSSSKNIATTRQADIPSNRLSTSTYQYICKVFTFTKAQNNYTLVFDLPRTYIHSIIIQIVTPHNCIMNITLWDSLDREFQVFNANISQGSGEISTTFGTAVAGNHTFRFIATTKTNLNIKITIKNTGIRCHFDKIPVDEQSRMIFYEVTCFSNGYFIQHDISLLSDHRYKFYIGRVSSISIALSNRGDVSYNITDPLNREFQIYGNDSLAGIADINVFTFGTAMAGTYTIDIEIYCDVPWMNVAYAIIDDGRICDPPPDTNRTHIENYFWIPIEWGLLTVIGVGVLVGAITVAIIYSRKKSGIGIKVRE